MERCVQFEVIPDPLEPNKVLDILALSEDGRLFIRRTELRTEDPYPLDEWKEITFPPKGT